jgi:hypothetical protein
MSWALRAASALTVAAGALSAQSAAAVPQVGAVAQREYLGATGTRMTGEAPDLVYDETVYANERVDTKPTGATNLVLLDRTNLYVGSTTEVDVDSGGVAALDDFETAAGDETADAPPPDWVRGRNSDHEKPTDRANRD